MVTHEPDVARYAKRNVLMRDGRIVSDMPVTARINAERPLSPPAPAGEVLQSIP